MHFSPPSRHIWLSSNKSLSFNTALKCSSYYKVSRMLLHTEFFTNGDRPGWLSLDRFILGRITHKWEFKLQPRVTLRKDAKLYWAYLLTEALFILYLYPNVCRNCFLSFFNTIRITKELISLCDLFPRVMLQLAWLCFNLECTARRNDLI